MVQERMRRRRVFVRREHLWLELLCSPPRRRPQEHDLLERSPIGSFGFPVALKERQTARLHLPDLRQHRGGGPLLAQLGRKRIANLLLV